MVSSRSRYRRRSSSSRTQEEEQQQQQNIVSPSATTDKLIEKQMPMKEYICQRSHAHANPFPELR